MSDMLERVARALQDACVGWEDDVRQGVAWPMLARAAIEAMRQPTPEMYHAAVMTHVYENGGIEHSPGLSWKAMIDAALLDRE